MRKVILSAVFNIAVCMNMIPRRARSLANAKTILTEGTRHSGKSALAMMIMARSKYSSANNIIAKTKPCPDAKSSALIAAGTFKFLTKTE